MKVEDLTLHNYLDVDYFKISTTSVSDLSNYIRITPGSKTFEPQEFSLELLDETGNKVRKQKPNTGTSQELYSSEIGKAAWEKEINLNWLPIGDYYIKISGDSKIDGYDLVVSTPTASVKPDSYENHEKDLIIDLGDIDSYINHKNLSIHDTNDIDKRIFTTTTEGQESDGLGIRYPTNTKIYLDLYKLKHKVFLH